MTGESGTLGLILAGGAGRRFGGRDKAWLRLCGRPLLCHAHAALAAQVDAVAVSSSRHRWAYRRLGLDVVADREHWRGRGPLAAVASVLASQAHRYRRFALLPVDVPITPKAWVARLHEALDAGAPAAAVFDGQRRQPLLALLDRGLASAAADAAAGTERASMQAWLDQVGVAWVPIEGRHCDFHNLNCADDLQALERCLLSAS